MRAYTLGEKVEKMRASKIGMEIFKRATSMFCHRIQDDPEAYFVFSQGNYWEYDTQRLTDDDVLCSAEEEEAVAAAGFFLERENIHAEALRAFTKRFDPEIIRMAPAAFGFGPGEINHYRLTRELVDQDGKRMGVEFILTHPFFNNNGNPLSWDYSTISMGVFCSHKPATMSVIVLDGKVTLIKGCDKEEELLRAEQLYNEKR